MEGVCRLAAALAGLAALAVAAIACGVASPAARAEVTPDYRHTLQVVSDLEAFPPAAPLVCILGGSSARSSTVSEASWASQIGGKVGTPVDAFNLASKERLLTQDRRLAGMLPQVHPLVYIGVNMGRFCRGHQDPSIALPAPSGQAPVPSDRTMSGTDALPHRVKQQMVEQWMVERWPAFLKNYHFQLGVLETTVERSLLNGQHPVIIDLPRNMAVMGHRLDKPLDLYHAGCRRIARRHHIPYVQFQGKLGLRDGDFRDLWHLLPKSRMKWQRQLSVTTAELLQRYGMAPQPAAPAAP